MFCSFCATALEQRQRLAWREPWRGGGGGRKVVDEARAQQLLCAVWDDVQAVRPSKLLAFLHLSQIIQLSAPV